MIVWRDKKEGDVLNLGCWLKDCKLLVKAVAVIIKGVMRHRDLVQSFRNGKCYLRSEIDGDKTGHYGPVDPKDVADCLAEQAAKKERAAPKLIKKEKKENMDMWCGTPALMEQEEARKKAEEAKKNENKK